MTSNPERRRHTFPRALSLQSSPWYRNVDRDSDQRRNFDEETSGFIDKSMSPGVSPRRMGTFCITGESVFRAVSYPSEDVPCSEITQPVNRSLQIGRPRSQAMGLKDVNLINNEQAEYYRLAREVNKSPKKSSKHNFSALRQVSCPGAMQFECGSQEHEETQFASVAGLSSVFLRHNPKQKADQVYDIDANEPAKGKEETQNYFVKENEAKLNPRDNFLCTGFLDSNSSQTQSQDLSSEENRKITSKKRRTNVLGFHDDEDSDVVVTEKCNSKSTNSEQKAENYDVSFNRTFSAFQLCKWTLSVFILIIGVGLYVHVNPHNMCLHGEFQTNLSGLGQALKEQFYGQHLAKRILESSLKSHLNKPKKTRKPLVLSLHGWTGIGKNFVSGIIADHLFKHGSQSPFVHKIIVPHNFAHESNAEQYEKQLISWFHGNVSKCSTRALFIFDEMDKIPSRLVRTIKRVLSHRGALAGVDYSNVIFLFLSNSGGNLINNHVLNHYRTGKKREQIELRDLEQILRESTNSADKWYHELLTSELIDHLVPFLPLEKSHVKQCIRNELSQKGHPVVENLVSEIADQMSYFPPDLQLFSKSGCKKVSSRVDVVMA